VSKDQGNGIHQIDLEMFREKEPVARAPPTPPPGWPEPPEAITLEEELASRGIDVDHINEIVIQIAPVGSMIDVHDVIDVATELPPNERAYFLAGLHQGLLLGGDL